MITKADRQLETVEQFIARLFPCQPPCDSYGVCSNCNDASLIRAGVELERKKSVKLVETLAMVDAVGMSGPCAKIVKQALEEYENDRE